jgi:hypothetical protein
MGDCHAPSFFCFFSEVAQSSSPREVKTAVHAGGAHAALIRLRVLIADGFDATLASIPNAFLPLPRLYLPLSPALAIPLYHSPPSLVILPGPLHSPSAPCFPSSCITLPPSCPSFCALCRPFSPPTSPGLPPPLCSVCPGQGNDDRGNTTPHLRW